MLDPVRDAHLKAAAESLAQSVFAFLQTCSQAAAALNSSVITAQAGERIFRGSRPVFRASELHARDRPRPPASAARRRSRLPSPP